MCKIRTFLNNLKKIHFIVFIETLRHYRGKTPILIGIPYPIVYTMPSKPQYRYPSPRGYNQAPQRQHRPRRARQNKHSPNSRQTSQRSSYPSNDYEEIQEIDLSEYINYP